MSGIAVMYQGDARTVMTTLPEESVNCCVTSPPYFGLRDYGTAAWEGGDAACDHIYNHGVQGTSGQRATRTFTAQAVYRDMCCKCGAHRVDQQIGLEPSPEAYVAELVAVFHEVRRVLKPEGTLWLNLGDSYASQGGAHGGRADNQKGVGAARCHAQGSADQLPRTVPFGLKPKDLIGIPWRVAFALQAGGWYLRSDIIWAKPNPMPESVRDRPTRSHEYVFLLSKSERYYYDAVAIAEPVAESQRGRVRADRVGGSSWKTRGQHSEGSLYKQDGHSRRHARFNQRWAATEDAGETLPTRNARDVWTIATKPYPEAHFATFPPELARRCVLAGCPVGGAVLDPFAGSGTTLEIAAQSERYGIGIELNSEYCSLAQRRLAKVGAELVLL